MGGFNFEKIFTLFNVLVILELQVTSRREILKSFTCNYMGDEN